MEVREIEKNKNKKQKEKRLDQKYENWIGQESL